MRTKEDLKIKNISKDNISNDNLSKDNISNDNLSKDKIIININSIIPSSSSKASDSSHPHPTIANNIINVNNSGSRKSSQALGSKPQPLNSKITNNSDTIKDKSNIINNKGNSGSIKSSSSSSSSSLSKASLSSHPHPVIANNIINNKSCTKITPSHSLTYDINNIKDHISNKSNNKIKSKNPNIPRFSKKSNPKPPISPFAASNQGKIGGNNIINTKNKSGSSSIASSIAKASLSSQSHPADVNNIINAKGNSGSSKSSSIRTSSPSQSSSPAITSTSQPLNSNINNKNNKNIKSKKIFAVIPAHNEEKYIEDVVKTTKKYVDQVIVVNDASKDKTSILAKNSGAIVLNHIINLHKGSSLKTGCEAAIKLGADIIVTLDGDGQHDPKEIPRLLNQLKDLDLVIGARKFDENMPIQSRIGNKILSSFSNFLFQTKISDSQTGFRAFNTNIYNKLSWESTGYEVETEMIKNISKNNLRYGEVEIETIYNDDYKGTTPIDGIKIATNMLKWRIKN